MKTKNKKAQPILETSTTTRIAAGAMAGVALVSTLTLLAEVALKSAKGAAESNNNPVHEIARLKDDTPSNEHAHDAQIFAVQPTSEAVLEFANEEELERLVR